MQIVKANCPSCGSPLYIEEDMTVVQCLACGSSASVERSQGEISLKFIEKIAAAIEQSASATRAAIRENSFVTRTELQQLQANQTLTTLQLQLSNLQAEIRGVQRNPQTPVTARQLGGLHQSEYHLYEQLQALQKQIHSPNPEDLQACIDSAKGEITYIDAEIAALTASDHPNRSNLVRGLNAQKAQLLGSVSNLKLQALRNCFSSFQLADPSAADPVAMAALLARVNTDEASARRYLNTPEGKALHTELQTRQQKLKSWLVQLDRARLDELIKSSGLQANPADLNSLKNLLLWIERDLSLDFSQFEPGVARTYQRALLVRKVQIQRQIQKLEKKLNKGDTPGLIDAIAAVLERLFGSKPSAPAQVNAADSVPLPLRSTPPSGQAPQALPSIAEVVDPAQAAAASGSDPTVPPAAAPGAAAAYSDESIPSFITSPAMPVKMASHASDYISAGAGCGLALVILVFFAVAGAVLFGVMGGATGSPETTPGWAVALTLLVTTLGFLLGSFVFLRLAVPKISIKGFGRMPSVVINPNRFGKGLQNLALVRIFIGLIICLVIYLITVTLVTLASDFSTGLSAISLVLGIVIGPILGLITALRTSLSYPD